ncbi:MAG: M18 family aminopeptidase [Clostridia bacterium]|nr:M18 family aminopeptidase [Clostridia bacterium]
MAYVNQLLDFINHSPTAFHTVNTIKEMLENAGYTELAESDTAAFSDGGKHFVTRGGSSIIAFKGRAEKGGFMITASHSDSPCFKIKNELSGASYTRLATERYGGMILYSWLDRPLSVAGRIVVKTDDGIKTHLVNIEKAALTIPSVAIHLNRGVNDGYKFNPATDLLPLAGTAAAKGAVMSAIADQANVKVEDIISHDLYLYNAEQGRVIGINDDMLLAPRIDDLGCVYASLRAFIDADESGESVSVLAVFDNEEVGSETKQGAASTFLDFTLKAIAGSDEKYSAMLYHSFMVSADNAHALHPNHPELYDGSNAPILGGGVVVKYNANQRYTTDAISDAIFTTFADRTGVKLQHFSNRADMVGGSTLGSISNTRVAMSTIDIGLPQLAMHSATETAAVSDLDDMIAVLKTMYSSGIQKSGEDIKIN